MERKIKEAPKEPKSVTRDQIKTAVSSSALSDGLALLPIDRRRLLSIISDIAKHWQDGTEMEYKAMEYGIEQFHKRLCEQKEKKG